MVVLFSINDTDIPVVMVDSKHDINIGMTKYDTPPNHGMLFQLRNMYSNLTMKGMKFPLFVIFLDMNMNVINTIEAHPEQELPIPYGTYYMLEIPL